MPWPVLALDLGFLNWSHLITSGILLADFLLRILTAARVISRRLPSGATLSWLGFILFVPFFGAIAYLVVGENRLGWRRIEREASILGPYLRWRREVLSRGGMDFSSLPAACEGIHLEATRLTGVPGLPGNRLELLPESEAALRSIIRDIDGAQRSCHLLFYIWHPGGTADEVGESLIRAVGRGVACRVLVDSLGSRPFLRSALCRRLRESGVQVVAALHVGLFRTLFVRIDLRNHRKIVVIDGEIAYTGSMNLVDPRFFKQKAGVGQWIDALVRIEGPAVELFAVAFVIDWELETGEGLAALARDVRRREPVGDVPVQLAMSGPGDLAGTIYRVLLSAIYTAQREIAFTTPYFVPDDALRTAIKSAALRGVDVSITVPAKVDSLLVRYASRSLYGELLAAGVKIFEFEGGLLHTKAVTVDGAMGFIGTVNLDQRSFWLNFEATLVVYHRSFAGELGALQRSYRERSRPVLANRWRDRPRAREFLECLAMLASPIL